MIENLKHGCLKHDCYESGVTSFADLLRSKNCGLCGRAFCNFVLDIMPAVVFLMFSAENADRIRLGLALGTVFSGRSELLLSCSTITVAGADEMRCVVGPGACESHGAICKSCKQMFCRVD